MVPTRSLQQLDPNDGVALRTYYESLRGWLDTEQASWRAHYSQLARYTMPRQQRFNYADSDRGERVDQCIVDNTATVALRTLGSGLVSGVCSPTRKWFDLTTGDDKLDELREVKIWLERVGDKLRAVLLKSNFYQTAHSTYRELGLYGTSAFQILEDETDGIRCYPWPVGSYYLAGDSTQRIDLHMRVVQMTVRQLVERFGFDACSSGVQTLYTSNAGGVKEQWFPVVNVIHRNRYLGNPLNAKDKPWVSVWYEMGSWDDSQGRRKKEQGLLKQSGFDECPVVAPRWDVVGEDFYGYSPGMDALGDTMALQLLQKRKSQAIDKMVNPPMVASPSMINQKMSILPGDITFADTREGSHGFRPAFQINYDIKGALEDIREHQDRINEAYYKTLFLMMAGSDRRTITAEEIRAKQEEKMLVLGPVLERSNAEFLEPAIRRALAIMSRRGQLPAPPDILRGRRVNIEFTSILAQAQRMLGIANIERFLGLIGNEGAVNQGVFDTVDLDEAARQYGDLLAIPATIMRDKKMVDQIRADKQLQAQQAQQAENAQKLAAAAQNLSNTDTTGQNGLTDLIRGQTGT